MHWLAFDTKLCWRDYNSTSGIGSNLRSSLWTSVTIQQNWGNDKVSLIEFWITEFMDRLELDYKQQTNKLTNIWC